MAGAIKENSDLKQILRKLDQLIELLVEQRLGGLHRHLSQYTAASGLPDAESLLLQSSEAVDEKRDARPALPDPRLIRRIIKHRQARSKFFGKNLFADPAWDMLLDLTAARAEHRRVSITSLSIASGVPATTSLRWINQLVDEGLLLRSKDDIDGRRAFVSLSDGAAMAMARFFSDVRDDNVSVL